MKKVLSLVLAVVLVVGLGAVAFAAKVDPDNLKKDNIENLKIAVLGDSGDLFGAEELYDETVRPGEKYEFILYYLNGDVKEYITKADGRNKKLGVQIRASEGSAAVKSAKVDYKKGLVADEEIAIVVVEFVDPHVSTKGQKFDVKFSPTIDRARHRDNEFTFQGELKNYEQSAYEGDEYIYVKDTPVVKAEEYIKNIEVDLGNNVSIFARMFEGKKYYGRAVIDITSDDEALFNKYPDLETVYKLDTVNLNATGDTVKFNLGDNMFAYVQDEDGNLVFLGRTNDRLPYYTKYFLSAKELDIEEVVDTGEPGEDQKPEEAGPTGGDDVPENVNHNPGTGR